jgi:L-amino acid N-acyltransferase YncA
MNPPTDLILRDCEERDLAAITAIYCHAVLSGFGTFEIEPPDEAQMRARHDAVIPKGLPYLVAEWEGRVVGYAYAGPYHSRAAYRLTIEDSIYIDPTFHGRGVGYPLLGRLIERATAAGFRQMVAVIGDSRNEGSIKIHAKHGFVHVGTLRDVGFKKERWLDVVIMQRALRS